MGAESLFKLSAHAVSAVNIISHAHSEKLEEQREEMRAKK